MTAAQQGWNDMNAKIEAGQIEEKACSDRFDASHAADISLVKEQVSYLDDTASNKIALMSINKKISDSEATALKKVIAGYSECRQIRLNTDLGTPFYTSTLEFYTQLEILYAKLLNKQITIGEFNQQKSQLHSQAMAKASEDLTNYRNSLAAAHNEEVAQRQRTAAIMLPYLAQQQAIQQQNMYNQQMLLRQQQPVNTNCIQFGNQINCSSW
jgi:hypothetical protein